MLDDDLLPENYVDDTDLKSNIAKLKVAGLKNSVIMNKLNLTQKQLKNYLSCDKMVQAEIRFWREQSKSLFRKQIEGMLGIAMENIKEFLIHDDERIRYAATMEVIKMSGVLEQSKAEIESNEPEEIVLKAEAYIKQITKEISEEMQ